MSLNLLKKYVDTRITDTRTNMDTGMEQIFIQQVGYEGATIHTLLALLTSLCIMIFIRLKQVLFHW